MKHSIKKQMIVIFISLLAFMCVAVLVCNVWLLGPYYIRNKEAKFISMYEALLDAEQNDELDTSDEETYSELVRLAEKNNLFFLAVNLKDQKLITNVQHTMDLQQNLDAFMLNRTEKNDRTLKKTDEYELTETRGKEAGTEYLMMRGTLGSNYIFLIQSPIESIQQSVALSNKFLIVVELIVLVVGIWMVWFFSKRLTEPLRELAGLSEKMAELDFDAKYTSGGDNEIGVLGENFNRMSEKLERSISDLKSANNQLLKDIEQKDRLEQMRNEFLGNVSHELKTPLTSMKVLADSLVGQEGVPEELYQEFMGDITAEIDRENKIITDLLSLVKMDKKAADLNVEHLNINQLLEDILKRLRPIADKRHIDLILDSFRPVEADVDEVKFTLAVSNLVENGIKYNVDDGWVRVTLDADHKYFYVKVADSGMGIPEESIGRIFERFYRVDKSHSKEIGGTGLGLAITRSAVTMHHGTIQVASKEGEGTTFTVRIPLSYIP